ncbi:glucosidase 2 subunit beta [Nasonia vitripennis]|uniref:Glucosidase 2 subunit beta n=1 Tax=Nasonia vitripennis TaxID=7425 RepID=A0A7M7H643_NASVI|nr:glucosidase 2 subunit beta [Nasonia vitripennis]XP_008208852.1 glucosidase 2 subunit beta [Nasonia vitripennis]
MQGLALLALTSLAVFLQTLGRHVAQAGSGKLTRIRGIPLSKLSLYFPDQDFECLDGSLIIPYARINDDYCDCADGSDEPGTAACTNGYFYCQNSGHQAVYISSSRVNDGVCDCCDASDEYSSDVQCVDNCHELGREAWLEAQRVAELAKKGNKIRLEYVQRGKQLKTENQAKLTKLRTDFEEAQMSKKEREVIKTRAEERETAALEKYKPPPQPEQQTDDTQEEEKEISEYEAEEYFKMLDSDSSGTITIAELQTRVTFDKDRNGEVSREEALFFLSNQEELTMQEFIDSAWANVKPFLMLEKGIFKPAEKHETEDEQQNQEHEEQHPSEETEEGHEEEEHDIDFEEEGHPGEVEDVTPEEHHEPEKPAPVQYDEETQAIIDEATQAREKFQEAERAVHDLQNEIRKIEERVERDYGPEEEFAALDGECFEFTDLEYVYSLCPFGKATQRSKSGGSEVNLGFWNDWIGGEDSSRYTKAKYDRGLTCWNGPARSTIVTLKCGEENQLLSVTEPNRCEYAMEFQSPAVCNPNNESVDVHDEL